MMRRNMPFGKEKMSQNDIDAMIYRTEAKLNIEGSKSGVKGGIFPAVASLAVMFALVIGGAYLSINSKNISSETDPAKTITPASEDSEESTSLAKATSGIVSDADETTDSIYIDTIDTSMLCEGVRYYYGDSAVVYLAVNNDRYAFESVSSENEHLRVTIESLLCDDITVNMIAKIEALDEVGEEYLKLDNLRTPQICAYDINGNYVDWMGGLYLYGGGSPDTDTCRYFVFDADKAVLGDEQILHLKTFANDSIAHAGEPDSGIVDIYTGIEFDIDTTSNLATLTLAAESGDEIYMSPLGFYRRREKTDMFKDVDDEYADRFIVERDARDFMVTYDNGTFMKYEGWSFGDYHYVINNIEKIDYNDQTYFPQ